MSAATKVGKTASVGPRMGYEVYEAKEPQECAYCERTIDPGERFTRRTALGMGSDPKASKQAPESG